MTHAEKWLAFHLSNPMVYTRMVEICRKMKSRGMTKWSARAVYHVLRWHVYMEQGKDADGFKLNDHYTSFYARLIMLRCPDLDGFFEVRVQPSKDKQVQVSLFPQDNDWRSDPFWKKLQYATHD